MNKKTKFNSYIRLYNDTPFSLKAIFETNIRIRFWRHGEEKEKEKEDFPSTIKK